MLSDEIKGSEIFPEGRFIYFEGEDPAAFQAALIRDYGFDPGPSSDEGFWCPPKIYDAIYCYPGPYGPLGS